MKKLCLLIIALSCLSALAAAQGGQVVEEIVTRVNGQIITRSEFDRSKDTLKDECKTQDAANPDKCFTEKEKDILRDLIDQQLLIEKGKDLSINGDTELIKRLDQMRKEMKLDSMEELEKAAASQGISYEDFKQNMRNQIVTQKVIGEEVGGHLSITKDEIQQFYDEHKAEMQMPEEIRLSEIMVSPAKLPDKAAQTQAPATADPGAAPADPAAQKAADDAAHQAADSAALATAEAKANDLLAQIQKGASFEDVAKKYSDGASAADGGQLGVFKRGQLAKELEDKTFAMKPGEVSGVIRTKQGYVILKVIEHQEAGIPPLKTAEPHIQDALYYQKLQPALRAYLTKLREEAYLKYSPGFVDTGASSNQTQPIETAAPKDPDSKKLDKQNRKKKKKLGIL
jgi:peptidyl-prolyl cis-trans isomerase SurA